MNSRKNHDDIKSSCSSIHNNSDCKQLYEAYSSFKLGSSLTIKLRLKLFQKKNLNHFDRSQNGYETIGTTHTTSQFYQVFFKLFKQ